MSLSRYRLGKSYFPLIFSAILLIIGTSVFADTSSEGTKMSTEPLYWLSLTMIGVAIFVPYWIHNKLEKRVTDLEQDVEMDERIYNLNLRIRILELENDIRSVEMILLNQSL